MGFAEIPDRIQATIDDALQLRAFIGLVQGNAMLIAHPDTVAEWRALIETGVFSTSPLNMFNWQGVRIAPNPHCERGRLYAIPMPPEHINCRCITMPINASS